MGEHLGTEDLDIDNISKRNVNKTWDIRHLEQNRTIPAAAKGWQPTGLLLVCMLLSLPVNLVFSMVSCLTIFFT